MNDRIYQAWHRKIGHAEYRLHITMAGYGEDEDAAEAFFEGFEKEHPESGAVISQDRGEDTITATFSLSATNDQHALDLGIMFWAESGVASELEPGDIVRVEIELIRPEPADAASTKERPKVLA